MRIRICCLFLVGLFILIGAPGYAAPAQHVILISFDGFRPDAIEASGTQKASAFYQMINEGASTMNARTDNDYTITLPNHTSMITGRPVGGDHGHHVTDNTIVDKTVHEYAGGQVASIFDMVRENNLKSAMLASKLKFDIYEHSFPIDTVFITDANDVKTKEAFLNLVQEGLPEFVFMHFAGTDRVGHHSGWSVKPGSAYMREVERLNGYLSEILEAIISKNDLKDSTVIIVTTDHGGEGNGHFDEKNPKDYTIPFIIWGKAVAKGVDLYKINHSIRQDPGSERISFGEPNQPIRNSDAANLTMMLLGLSPIVGSTVGFEKPLRISEDEE